MSVGGYKVCGVGAGILGVPVCAVMAWQCPNISVAAVDNDKELIAQWNRTEGFPISEPGLVEILDKCKGRNLVISSEIERHMANADMILICVKTPAKTLGVGRGRAADLGSVEYVTRQIVASGNSSAIIVLLSTVPIGTTDLIGTIFKANNKESNFVVLSNPQFVSEGNVIENLLHPDRVLIGSSSKDTEKSHKAVQMLKSIYRRWVPEEKILTMSAKSAEVAKLVTNAFLAQRVSSINAISSVCEETAADVRQVAMAVGRDTRIGTQYLEAGLGFGGNTLPADLNHLVYTCESLRLPDVAAFWSSVLTVNDFQVTRFFRKITAYYCETLRGKRLAIFGCAFKKGTPEVKNSPAIMICCRLLVEEAFIAVYDPLAQIDSLVEGITETLGQKPGNIGHVVWCDSPAEAAKNADGIIVCTDCDEFKNLDYLAIYKSMRKPACFFDGRLVANHQYLKDIGFGVEAVGISLT